MTHNLVAGMETSAISVLKRAVELDHGGRFQESLVCYQEGIQLLMDVLKGNVIQRNTVEDGAVTTRTIMRVVSCSPGQL